MALAGSLAQHGGFQVDDCDPAALPVLDSFRVLLIEEACLAATLRTRGLAVPIVPLVRPVRLPTLLARINAVLRQPDTVVQDAPVPLGPGVLHPLRREWCGPIPARPVRLTAREVALLLRLYRANGAIVSREILLHEVFGYRPDLDTHTLETHIYRLRQKLVLTETVPEMTDDPAAHAGSAGSWLETVPGGYRLRLG